MGGIAAARVTPLGRPGARGMLSLYVYDWSLQVHSLWLWEEYKQLANTTCFGEP